MTADNAHYVKRLGELSPAEMKQVRSALNRHPSGQVRRVAATASPPGSSTGARWWCHQCGYGSNTLAAIERHCHTERHLRYELKVRADVDGHGR